MSNMKKNNPLGNAENPDNGANHSSLALAAMRLSVAPLLPKIAAAPSTPKDNSIGELRSVAISDIEIDARFRKDLGDIAGLAASIQEVGLLQPVILTPDMRLVSGMRRLQAHKHLGREAVVARVMDIEDPNLASIEEDVARKPLTSSEKFAVTESLRAKMVDDAWKRRALGGRLEAADKKGRADDLLAKHVGISRPTLAKIRQIVEAGKRDPSRFGKIAEELDKDGKVDRHYKALSTEVASDSPTPKFKAIIIEPSWAQVEEELLRKAVFNLQLKSYCTDETFLLLPTSIQHLPRANSLLAQARLAWKTALEGSETDNQRIWLVATCGKTLPQQFDFEAVSDSCMNGTDSVYEEVGKATDDSFLKVDFNDLCAHEEAG